jgi:serine/threonine-protein kinase
MGRTLVEIPAEVPPAAQGELAAERGVARKAAARASALRFVMWGLFVPFVFWMGVRDWTVSLTIIAFIWSSGLFALWMSSRKTPGERSLFVLLFLSSCTIALISGLVGPFMLTPVLAATNAMYFSMALESRNRIWAIIGSVAAITLPIAAEILGLVPPSYRFGAHGFELLPRTAFLPEGATLTMLLFTSIATAIIPVLLVGRLRDALTSAEQRLFLQAWHLRAVIPGKPG